jgi:hypothetical protein
MGASLVATGYVTRLWHLYLWFGVVSSIGLAATGPVVGSAVLSAWFARRRATALSVLGSASMAGMTLLVPATMWCVLTYGWRMTYVLFGVASVVLIVPLGVFFVRNTPEALGLTPDGLPAASSAGPVALDTLSFDNYGQALSEIFFRVFRITMRTAGLGTILCALIGFPAAYALALHVPARWRSLLVFLLILPYWTSFLLRTFAWRIILTPDGTLAHLLKLSGLTNGPLLVLDTTRPPFDDPRARAAVDAVLDRRDLATRWSEGGEPRFGLGFFEPRVSEPPRLEALTGSVTIAVADDVPLLLSRRVVALVSSLGVRVVVAPPGVRPQAAAQARLLRFSPEVPERALQLRELLVLAGAPADRIAALETADALADPSARRAALDAVAAGLEAERSCLALVGLPLAFAARDGVHGARFDASSRLVLEDAWREER